MGTAYCLISDFDRYFENFFQNYYGTYLSGSIGTIFSAGTNSLIDDISNSSRRINQKLDAIPHIPRVPVGTQSDGKFPAALIEWNVYDTIYRKILSRHQTEWNDIPEWINSFKDNCDFIYEGIVNQNIVFPDEVSIREKGIGAPSVISKSGNAVFYNNYQTGKFLGEGIERDFVIKIDGTDAGNNVGLATFRWSYDNGVSWSGTAIVTGTTWTGLKWGVNVLWSPSGTSEELTLDDSWGFKCVPLNISGVGEGVTARYFSR